MATWWGSFCRKASRSLGAARRRPSFRYCLPGARGRAFTSWSRAGACGSFTSSAYLILYKEFRPPGRSTVGITLSISRLAAQTVQPRTQVRSYDLIVKSSCFLMVTGMQTLSAESGGKVRVEFVEALFDHGGVLSDATAGLWAVRCIMPQFGGPLRRVPPRWRQLSRGGVGGSRRSRGLQCRDSWRWPYPLELRERLARLFSTSMLNCATATRWRRFMG